MTVAIGGLAFPAVKVLKLRRMLNDNGGARTVATAFRALNSEEKRNYAATTLGLGVELAGEFLGFTEIAERC